MRCSIEICYLDPRSISRSSSDIIAPACMIPSWVSVVGFLPYKSDREASITKLRPENKGVYVACIFLGSCTSTSPIIAFSVILRDELYYSSLNAGAASFRHFIFCATDVISSLSDSDHSCPGSDKAHQESPKEDQQACDDSLFPTQHFPALITQEVF